MITNVITITDGLSPDIARKIASLENTRPLMRAVGEAVRRAMREHYAALPQNARGFPSKGFWRRYGVDKVAIDSFDQTQVTIKVASVEMGHKYFGGTVRQGEKKLSIPVSPEAYRTGSASLWTGPKLTLIKRPGKPALLVDANNPEAWTIHYVLKSSVVHRPDSRAFPPRVKVEAAARSMIVEKIGLIMRSR